MSLLHMKIIKKKENKRKTRLMLNIEKYKDDILNAKQAHLTCSVYDIFLKLSHISCTGNCKECKKNIMNWLLEEYKDPILDDVEIEYLSAVIKPFRSRVQYIVKWKICNDFKQFLHIELSDGDSLSFPNFKENTMYKGMKVGKYYTPEELGL